MDPTATTREQLRCRFMAGHGLTALEPENLDRAFTHRSYAYEMGLSGDNERLEFLGDAFLSAVTSEYLYEHFPDAAEGTLSKHRSQLVSRTVLGRRAEEMGFGPLMLLGRGERETGGAHRRSTLGSALEALIAVLYLSLGYAPMREFIRRHVLDVLFETAPIDLVHGDFKSALQETLQRRLKKIPSYTVLAEEGPDHDKRFLVQVEVAGRVLAQASGERIKIAENEAARLALEKIERDEVTLDPEA